ncbi:hypothetical protein F5148DRAFT_1160377 [Russula earlei]|uniref:Uncharacterized protein n=1 Tax=Russula earlei TaxID=71964 RepID=A0ACC0UPR4_9AGAM|nr:hypothetical protein F5148DRAFT_1160377 [Russula earlei]
MNMKWVSDGSVHSGAFCTSQGLIKQLADVGTALSAGSVAIYTFSSLIFRLRLDTNVSRAVLIVAGIWTAIILNVVINIGINGASRFYGPTGPWCWILPEFKVERTVGDFMWMWISAFSSLLAYVAVFLVLKGFIAVEGWRVRWTYGQESPAAIPRYHILAYKMLAYPIIYIITVLPLAAARYNSFAGRDTPFAVVVLADGFYLSSGFLNVLLYRYTRPFLLPQRTNSIDGQSMVLHSNGRIHIPSPNVLHNITYRASEGDASSLERKLTDPAHGTSHIISTSTNHQDGTSLMAESPSSHDHGNRYGVSEDRWGSSSIYDDV